ncbi:hypothetical protein T440DRAFT_408923 [Plenodomus tracheiphilus IPT5]|uniref:F-box domain-containing protein n=1 Tax=Plenodomus tracheiphilus IPT5 TaxID=1408161 RepID=A0A6A7AQN3_9PLEO|nr:hypothetical protein T440DRAFT_408923 [Plenodomus tracheiphilus IPT5]
MSLVPPPDSPLNVTEILILIFTNLDGPDLVRISLAYIDMKEKYRNDRLMLEEAGDVSEEDFERIRPPIVLRMNRHGFRGKPVLEAMQDTDADLRKIREGATWNNNRNVRRHHEKGRDIRASFRGVRLCGSGWPVGLREIYCEICERFHTRFHFDHVHPALRFLEDANICVRGHGTILLIELDLFNEAAAPRSCYEHYCEEMIDFAKGLSTAIQMISPGGCGKEFFTNPITSKIEMFTAHKQRFPEIVEMVDQAIITVDEIMRDVDMWQSISTTELERERHWTHSTRMADLPVTDTEDSE